MHQEYNSRWHKLVQLIHEGELRIVRSVNAATYDVYISDKMRDIGWNSISHEAAVQMTTSYGKAAHFVISPELIAQLRTKFVQFRENMIDLAKHDMLRLPFKDMMLEFDDPHLKGATVFMYLCQPEGQSNTFEVHRFNMRRLETGEDEIIFWPVKFTFSLRYHDDKAIDDLTRTSWAMHIEAMGEYGDEACNSATANVTSDLCYFGVVFATLVWRTRGVERATVHAPIKLNSARARSGKSLLKDYQILRIGAVQGRDGKMHTVSPNRGPIAMPIHWRCGHWRNQFHGAGRKEHKKIWIEPILVNYVGDDDHTPTPKFLATV